MLLLSSHFTNFALTPGLRSSCSQFWEAGLRVTIKRFLTFCFGHTTFSPSNQRDIQAISPAAYNINLNRPRVASYLHHTFLPTFHFIIPPDAPTRLSSLLLSAAISDHLR